VRISSSVKDDVLIVSLEGEITLGNANEVNDYVNQKISSSQNHVIFNMKKVEYLDSSAVGMIVAIYSTLQADGGALRICGVSSEVMEILKASSLETYLNIDESEEQSLIAIV
jgi:anti-sigma B factor antagonist